MYAVTKGVKFEASGSCNLPCSPLIFENPYNPTRNYDNDDDDDDPNHDSKSLETKHMDCGRDYSVIL